MLSLNSKLLRKNPEYYTIWNRRRSIIQYQFAQSLPSILRDKGDNNSTKEKSVITKLISDDLEFLFPLLRKFPKCYWIWNYRLWLLQESSKIIPISDARQFWLQELGLASKMLSLDSRNFLGWGYRRTVVAAIESKLLNFGGVINSMATEEYEYTTRMIKSNLSNFSAWHNRSKLIPRLLEEREADDEDRRAFLDKGIP